MYEITFITVIELSGISLFMTEFKYINKKGMDFDDGY